MCVCVFVVAQTRQSNKVQTVWPVQSLAFGRPHHHHYHHQPHHHHYHHHHHHHQNRPCISDTTATTASIRERRWRGAPYISQNASSAPRGTTRPTSTPSQHPSRSRYTCSSITGRWMSKSPSGIAISAGGSRTAAAVCAVGGLDPSGLPPASASSSAPVLLALLPRRSGDPAMAPSISAPVAGATWIETVVVACVCEFISSQSKRYRLAWHAYPA